MGRWTFEDGSPLYIPDEGEEGGGSMLGHLGMGVGKTAGDALGAILGAPGVSHALTALGAPARAVTAVGHSMAPGGYQGTTDPIDYIMTGQKNDEADLAHYGDLLADTMEAEGTLHEGSAASKVIRKAGEAISDPLILLGVTRAAARPAARAPGLRDRRIGGEGVRADRMRPPRQRTPDKVPVSPDKGPKAPEPHPLQEAIDYGPEPPPLKTGGGPRLTEPKKTTRYRHPPVDPEDAAKFPSAPLDTDLASPGAFTTGGTKPLAQGGRPPRGATAARRTERHGRAREMGRQEQLDEGLAAVRREQMIPPRAVLRDLIRATVEQGGSADDVMALISNLTG